MNGRWQSKAACAGFHPDYFHPVKAEANLQTARAKAVCASCDYGYECLISWLSSSGQTDIGIYFGTTPKDRWGLKTALRPALGIQPLTLNDFYPEFSKTPDENGSRAITGPDKDRERERARRYRARKKLEAAA